VCGPKEGFIPVRLGRARWSRITTTATFFSFELDIGKKTILVPTGIPGVNDPAAFVTAFEDQAYIHGVRGAPTDDFLDSQSLHDPDTIRYDCRLVALVWMELPFSL
jgi:hypothetical protein